MKHLFKIIAILSLAFATTFLILKGVGILSIDQIKVFIEGLESLPALYVFLTITTLLFIDLFIAVPTLTIIVFSGYFLGHTLGFIASSTGLLLVGIVGYSLGGIWGNKLLNKIIKSSAERIEAKQTFQENGFIMIICSRALPILPEVSACLAGITKMRFSTFISAWLVSSLPYAFIASYAGSISTFDNPKPAILIAISLSATMWGLWFFINYRRRKKTSKTASNS